MTTKSFSISELETLYKITKNVKVKKIIEKIIKHKNNLTNLINDNIENEKIFIENNFNLLFSETNNNNPTFEPTLIIKDINNNKIANRLLEQ